MTSDYLKRAPVNHNGISCWEITLVGKFVRGEPDCRYHKVNFLVNKETVNRYFAVGSLQSLVEGKWIFPVTLEGEIQKVVDEIMAIGSEKALVRHQCEAFWKCNSHEYCSEDVDLEVLVATLIFEGFPFARKLFLIQNEKMILNPDHLVSMSSVGMYQWNRFLNLMTLNHDILSKSIPEHMICIRSILSHLAFMKK